MAELNFPASDIENKQNKVDAINLDCSSEQYPSAPAVVNYVQSELKNANSDKSYENNNFASALKGSLSGAAVFAEDVSPIEHDVKLRLVSDSITDFSNVSVIVSSSSVKSFSRNNNMTIPEYSEWDCIEYENGNIEYILKTPFSSFDRQVEAWGKDIVLSGAFMLFNRTDLANFTVYLEGKAYVFANYDKNDGSETDIPLYFPISNFRVGNINSDGYTEIIGDFTVPTTFEDYTYGANGAFALYSVSEFRIKLVANENELPTDAAIFIANADGTVEGVKSLSPSMAVATDNQASVVEFEYNRDINKLESGGAKVDLSEYVKKTDYATKDTAGVVKVFASRGISIDADGIIGLQSANKALVNEKKNTTYPIMSNMVDYAVKSGLTTNTETLTDEEKEKVLAWLGVNDKLGDIEAVLDNIIAVQEELIGTITFIINGISYTALKGMTWGEWVDSPYNTINAYFDEYQELVCTDGNIGAGGNPATPDEPIIDGGTYSTF